MDQLQDKWIGLDEAADYLEIKPVTLRKWIKEGKDVPTYKIGRLWKFKCSELDEMRFVTNGDVKHDILNTFSSGQLSGFVLLR